MEYGEAQQEDESTTKAAYNPTEEDIIEYARFLGILEEEDAKLLFIAREGIAAPLPPEWKPCQDEDGEIFYFNFSTGESSWDHPSDSYFRT
eukprot:gene31079-38986_t